MSRLIDAEVLANWIDGSQRLDTEHDYDEVARYIEECPTVDAVPVVRCKDCKWLKNNDCKNDTHGYIPIDENDFCSRGEREGENTDG